LKDYGKNTANPFRWSAPRFLGRLLSACLLVIAVFYIISPFYIRLLLPAFAWEIEMLNPKYRVVHKDIIKIRQVNYLQMDIEVSTFKSSDQQETKELNPVTRHKAQASSLCIAPIIIITLILAWPALPLSRRLKAFIFSLPMIALIQCMDYPLIFISNIASVYSNNVPMNTIFKIWSHILNNGGRQFLSLIAFLLAISPHYLTHTPSQLQSINSQSEKTGRNAPCPCGSGIKYKNCCLSKSSDHKSTGY
jgi:hypothetical protein